MALGGLSLRAKVVHLILLVDVSGSMASDAKIQSLNAALEEVLPSLRREARDLVGIEPRVRVATFASSVRWVQDAATPLDDFWWQELPAVDRGLTELGAALEFVRISLDDEAHELPPAIVLLTDGMPTNTVSPSFSDALRQLDAHPVGRSAARAAIAIGRDADHQCLEAFVATGGGSVLSAQRPQQLAELIRRAGTSVLRTASEPSM